MTVGTIPAAASKPRQQSKMRFARRVALAYGAAGALWVCFFDVLLPLLVTDASYLTFWAFAEGWVYVTATTWLLYRLIKHHLRSLNTFTDLLQAKERYLAKVLETLPVGIWLIDQKGDLIQSNPAAEAIWHYARRGNDGASDGCYKGWWADSGRELKPLEWGAVRALRDGESTLDQPIEIAFDDDSRRVILQSAVPLRDADNGIIGVVVVNQDITETKRIERELRENQRRLTAMTTELAMAEEQERRRIASELHDQIGQALALCKIRLEQLDGASASEGAGTLLKVRELLSTTIHQVRTLTFEVSPPLLYQVGLEATVEWLGERFHEDYGFAFQFHGEADLPPLAEELRVTLFQLVRELLVNIAKHAAAKNVAIDLRQAAGMIVLTVSDDGCGFDPPASLGRPVAAITGYGLFNARRRIEHLGGCMTVDSRRGAGTTITLQLPL